MYVKPYKKTTNIYGTTFVVVIFYSLIKQIEQFEMEILVSSTIYDVDGYVFLILILIEMNKLNIQNGRSTVLSKTHSRF